jgi:hypothetical protein
LGRGDILGARMRLHEEEESRSQGPIVGGQNCLKFEDAKF